MTSEIKAMTEQKGVQEEKIQKINQIKNYLDDLNIKLKQAILESSSKMQEVVRKKEEKEMQKLLEDLKKM